MTTGIMAKGKFAIMGNKQRCLARQIVFMLEGKNANLPAGSLLSDKDAYNQPTTTGKKKKYYVPVQQTQLKVFC